MIITIHFIYYNISILPNKFNVESKLDMVNENGSSSGVDIPSECKFYYN